MKCDSIMKVLIDGSNLYGGGGLQVATSFLYDLLLLDLSHEYGVILSPNLSRQIDQAIFDDRFCFYELSDKAYNRLWRRRSVVRKIENEICPDVIFTVFGPSYHKSKFPKVVGFAYAHIVYSDSPFFNDISFKERIKHQFISSLKKWFFVKKSDALVFETEDARRIFKSLVNGSINTYTVGNTLNEIFDHQDRWKDISKTIPLDAFNILCLTAFYPHKNLSIIPKIIDELLKGKIPNFKFLITCTKDELMFDEKYDDYVLFLDRIPLDELPSLYQQSSMVFMPTLLEVFSATYIEAMFMGKPLVVSDLGFARDICDDAALYCDPLDVLGYAATIECLYFDDSLKLKLTNKGYVNLKRFGRSVDRTKAYIDILEKHALK